MIRNKKLHRAKILRTRKKKRENLEKQHKLEMLIALLQVGDKIYFDKQFDINYSTYGIVREIYDSVIKVDAYAYGNTFINHFCFGHITFNKSELKLKNNQLIYYYRSTR